MCGQKKDHSLLSCGSCVRRESAADTFEIVFRKLAKLLHGMDSGKLQLNNECL